MRTRLKSVWHTFNEERGAAFLIILILLMLGGLVLPPLLGLIGTGLATGRMYENRAYELYAADAGVMDAIWLLQSLETPEKIEAIFSGGKYTYTLPEEVNSKAVEYEIIMDGAGYVIKSTATGLNGSSTTIETRVQYPQELDLLYFAAASLDGDLDIKADVGVEENWVNIYANGDIYMRGNSQVYGNAYYTDGHGIKALPPSGEFYGEPIESPVLRLAESAIPAIPEDTVGDLVIDNSRELGPVYVQGNLTITGQALVELTGTVWVTGQIVIDAGSGVQGTRDDGELYFLISDYNGTGRAIEVAGNIPGGYDYKVEAVLYAPDGHIYVAGSAGVNGSAIGKSVEVLGGSNLSNPLPFEEVPVGYYPMKANYWKIY